MRKFELPAHGKTIYAVLESKRKLNVCVVYKYDNLCLDDLAQVCQLFTFHLSVFSSFYQLFTF